MTKLTPANIEKRLGHEISHWTWFNKSKNIIEVTYWVNRTMITKKITWK